MPLYFDNSFLIKSIWSFRVFSFKDLSFFKDFPTKELRQIVDQSKKDIKEGIVVGFSTFEGKVGVAVGVTNELTNKYDAVTLVKIASEVLGCKGGGGRRDFAQAGGTNKDKIEEAFKTLSKKIN